MNPDRLYRLATLLTTSGESIEDALDFVTALEKEFFAPPIVRFRYDRDIAPNGEEPSYATEGSWGADLVAAAGAVLSPGRVTKVRTGLHIELPEDYEAQVRPRSGLGSKGITVINSPGTIDQDYKGEVCVMLVNTTNEPYNVEVGDRIAQLVVARACRAQFRFVTELSSTARGDKGFGSTGR